MEIKEFQNLIRQIYLERDKKLSDFRRKLETKGTAVETYLHTSGHAGIGTLKRFARKIAAKTIIPIHTSNPALYKEIFIGKNILELKDGQEIEI